MLKFNPAEVELSESIPYLNTSYVKVQLFCIVFITKEAQNLNTSYVKVQFFVVHLNSLATRFKYILC